MASLLYIRAYLGTKCRGLQMDLENFWGKLATELELHQEQ